MMVRSCLGYAPHWDSSLDLMLGLSLDLMSDLSLD